MNVVDVFFDTPIPDKVWHYTSVAALEGIISSGAVWATEVRFTNDKTEFIHARDVAESALEEIMPADKITGYAKSVAQDMVKTAFEGGPLSSQRTEVFVASFSSAKDLKSQWMEYADGGRGVSIAFDLREIRPPRELMVGVTFAPCVYTPEAKRSLFEALFQNMANEMATLNDQVQSRSWAATQLREWMIVNPASRLPFDRAAFDAAMGKQIKKQIDTAQRRFGWDLLRLASHFKEPSFHQECEWRLALPHLKGKPMVNAQVMQRGNDPQIPYVAHNLFQERLPITEVMIGPLCIDGERVQELLRRYGHQANVSRSSIPLRSR
jgi:hypothetical protein